MPSRSPTSRQRHTAASIIAGVRALGRYHESDNDEDYDRAATYPCQVTEATVNDGMVVIHHGCYGGAEGYFYPVKGERVSLDIATIRTIFEILDDSNFPIIEPASSRSL